MIRVWLTLVSVLAPAAWACADDGWEPLQGSPGSLTEHPSVSMVSEVVRVAIGKESATVNCTFVFKNNGPTCIVRMRFPDDSSTHDQDDKPSSVFDYFRSSIDGKRARVAYSESERGWIKSVRFSRGQTWVIRDHYRVKHEILDLTSKARTAFGYTLSTGGTWRGDIERAEIRITF